MKKKSVVNGWYPGMKVRVLRNHYASRRPDGSGPLVPGDVVEVDYLERDDINGMYWVVYLIGDKGFTNRIPAKDCEWAEKY